MNKLTIINNQDSVLCAETARQLTEAIQATSAALYVLLKKAHDGKIWLPLGYETWQEYVEAEFDFSRARSYQLISQANVIEAIEVAAGIEDYYIDERQAREVKKALPTITKRIKSEIEGVPDDEKKDIVASIIDEETNKSSGKHNEQSGESELDEEPITDEDLELARREGFKEGLDQVSDALYDQSNNPKVNHDFYVENLIRTLSIFEALPDPDKMAKIVKQSGDNQDNLVTAIHKVQVWTSDFLDKLT